MKVSVDKKKCVGCGACVALCPKIFIIKEEKSIVKTPNTDDECAKSAADACPVNAIKIEK